MTKLSGHLCVGGRCRRRGEKGDFGDRGRSGLGSGSGGRMDGGVVWGRKQPLHKARVHLHEFDTLSKAHVGGGETGTLTKFDRD